MKNVFCLIAFLISIAFGQNPVRPFPPGSYIIDMGQSVQTIANGLKPYGLVYQLIITEGIPVNWAIKSSKLKDGVDFIAGDKSYRGGSFIVAANRITPSVIAIINTWKAKGVVVDGPMATTFSTPVYKELTSWPRAILDAQNDKLVVPFYTNAEISTASYVTAGNPTMLTHCGDVYVLPHADPQDWTASSGYADSLKAFVKNDGYLYASCHAVSALESIAGCNFLSNEGLVLWSDHGNGTVPYTYSPTAAADPIMQYLGTLDASTQNGSEQIYLPKSAGWRNTTTVAVYDPDDPDVPGLSPGPASILAYGRAFGTQGMVVVNAGHALDQGTEASRVAAQRAYFNFLLMAGVQKQVLISDIRFPVTLTSGAAYTLNATVGGGIAPYTFLWTSTGGGTFSDPTSNPTTFTAPARFDTCVIKLKVMDECGRINFASEVYINQGGGPVGVVPDSAVTIDRNGNGYIDNIILSFNGPVAVTDANINGFIIRSNGYVLPIDSIVKINDSTYRLALREVRTAVPQTAWTPEISIDNVPSVQSVTNFKATDGCPPVVWKVEKIIVDSSRIHDSVKVYMSGRITAATGGAFNIGTDPQNVFTVWSPQGTTLVKDTAMLAGIDHFERVIGDSIAIFLMSNGKDLTTDNFMNILSENRLVRDNAGNFPDDVNQKVRISFGGIVMTIFAGPNPAHPTLMHPDQLKFAHEPNAINWVRQGQGTIISIKNITRPASPDDAGKVRGVMKIIDVIGNTVNWCETSDLFGSIPNGNGSTPGMNLYWNGLNERGMMVAPGVYRVVVYINYPSMAKIANVKVIAKVGISR
jgi:hypothetical protein